MDTPMRSNNALNSALQCIKPEIRALAGYTAPPQETVVAKLNQNENPYDIPQDWKTVILQKMQQIKWPLYPEYNPGSLKNRLAQWFNVNEDQILLGHGSNQLLYLICTSVIVPGDSVIITPPTFSLFDLAVRIFQGRILNIDKQNNFSLDMDAMIPAAKTAKLILLCSPDNPTGIVIPLDQLTSILQNTRGLVIWDEAYTEFGGKSALPLLEDYPNLIISRTFSKAFGLAGLRLGYLIGHPDIIRELQKANIPYNVNLFTLLTANYLLDHREWMDQHVKKIVSDRQKLFDQMQKIPQIKPFISEANFILFKTSDKKKIFDGLKARGILVRDVGNKPPLDCCLRVTVGTPRENKAFLNAVEEIVKTVEKPF
ncbi:histidinol-phosphate transaminase [bacterium]|nr:histidinol-phosphate transaminase [bacterium]